MYKQNTKQKRKLYTL